MSTHKKSLYLRERTGTDIKIQPLVHTNHDTQSHKDVHAREPESFHVSTLHTPPTHMSNSARTTRKKDETHHHAKTSTLSQIQSDHAALDALDDGNAAVLHYKKFTDAAMSSVLLFEHKALVHNSKDTISPTLLVNYYNCIDKWFVRAGTSSTITTIVRTPRYFISYFQDHDYTSIQLFESFYLSTIILAMERATAQT